MNIMKLFFGEIVERIRSSGRIQSRVHDDSAWAHDRRKILSKVASHLRKQQMLRDIRFNSADSN